MIDREEIVTADNKWEDVDIKVINGRSTLRCSVSTGAVRTEIYFWAPPLESPYCRYWVFTVFTLMTFNLTSLAYTI